MSQNLAFQANMGKIKFYKDPPIYHACVKWNEKLDAQKIYKLQNKFLRLVSSSSVQLQCFVVMASHLHFMVHGSDEGLLYIQENLDGEFWRKPIKNWATLKETYRYILRNPVDAGIARNVEDYPFSSINLIVFSESTDFFIYDPFYLHLNAPRILNWLNNQELGKEFYLN